MEVRAETLLDDYNHYRFKTASIQQLRSTGRPVGALGKKNLPVFESLAGWCQSKRVEPRRWLASLFEQRRWMFAPKLQHLESPRHLKKYPDIGSIPAYQTRIQQERAKLQHINGETFDPNRDLSAGAEALKRRYLDFNRSDHCMSLMTTETYGYHPGSRECSRCPKQAECTAKLQGMVTFDIQGLRSGTITADQARASVYYGRRPS